MKLMISYCCYSYYLNGTEYIRYLYTCLFTQLAKKPTVLQQRNA